MLTPPTVDLRPGSKGKRLLARTDAPIGAAVACGYADQPHLTREVRALAGITPRELRAFLQLARSPAEEPAVDAVRIRSIRAAGRTPRTRPGAEEKAAAVTALGRLGRPADIADVVAFLAGPDSRWITGQNIRATGGFVL